MSGASSVAVRSEEAVHAAVEARSLGQTCFTDGLHSIFSFLTLDEFDTASRCCRSWFAAALSQPPLRKCVAVRTRMHLVALSQSHLSRHVAQLQALLCRPRDLGSSLSLCRRVANLAVLDMQFADDVWLEGEVDLDGGGEELMQLPSTLQELHLRFHFAESQPMEWSPIDSVLSHLCRSGMPPLTTLRVEIAGWNVVLPTQLSPATLRRMLVLKDSLTEFTILFKGLRFQVWNQAGEQLGPLRWTREHIDVFRQLTHLEKLDPFVGRWSDEELIMLAEDPAPENLRFLPLRSHPTTAEGVDALSRLPLAEVHFDTFPSGPIDVAFLGRMPRLESLTLDLGEIYWEDIRPNGLVQALGECTQLTRLDLTSPLTNEHWCDLLPLMPHLRDLRIMMMSSYTRFEDFGELSFASTVPHLADTLERLELVLTPAHQEEPTPIRQVRHLYALTSLRHLCVILTVPLGTTEVELARVVAKCDSRHAAFNRRRWPHMEEAQLTFPGHGTIEEWTPGEDDEEEDDEDEDEDAEDDGDDENDGDD